MISSMTGYGNAVGMIREKMISVEIKSLNSKQLDISLRLPNLYSEYENEIRSMVMQRLERGKVYCMVNAEMAGEDNQLAINTTMAKRYFTQLKELEKELSLEPTEDYLALLLRIPDVMKPKAVAADEEEIKALMALVEQALEQMNHFRSLEGKTLSEDIRQRIKNIRGRIEKIDPFEKQRIVRLRERIGKALDELGEKGIDQNRFEQEMIYYMEKWDITEEKVRLKSHLDYFLSVMNEVGANGRKLGFIAQEIGREINTLGSKANDSEMQMIVVEMKDELEKIKEQLMNIL